MLNAMQRNAQEVLSHWYGKTRRKPLVLRGARQVGKSTLVRLFTQHHKIPLAEINLEVHRDLDKVFASFDMNEILLNLQSVAGMRIDRSCLLFLDEIQATPHALAALRYFYEDRPEIPVLAAGSLMEFTLADHNFSMPVGRIEYLHLGPMTFPEFLEAVDPLSLEAVEQLDPEKTIPAKTHSRLLQLQREFMLTGGLPESVEAFRETGSFEEVVAVQNSITQTYMDDFSKYAKHKDLANLQSVFRSIPRLIGRKLKYTQVLPGVRSSYTRGVLELLAKARIVQRVIKSDCSGVPLAAGADLAFAKLLFLDVGLVSRILGTDWLEIQKIEESELVNKGSLAEQVIGQHLHMDAQTSPELYYWARESRSANAELDFVVSQGSLVLPVEVKAGKAGTLKSLHFFMYQKRLAHAVRFSLQPPSTQIVETSVRVGEGLAPVRYALHSLPLYAVGRLPWLMDSIRQGS